jgi:hypothetical protein
MDVLNEEQKNLCALIARILYHLQKCLSEKLTVKEMVGLCRFC